LTVPPATSSGKRLRVKGHGVQTPSGGAGDLYAEIQIALPKSLDPESQELVRQFDQRQSHHPRSNLKW
jgi:curved DNA-binding protein